VTTEGDSIVVADEKKKFDSEKVEENTSGGRGGIGVGDDFIDKKLADIMSGASKEENPNDVKKTSAQSDEDIISIVTSAAKKVAVVGVIYFVGYMGWSVAWLISK